MELGAIDHLFSEHWCGKEVPFLAELMASARAGHLCVFAKGDPDLPTDLVYEGALIYPKQPVVRLENAYYLQRHWAAETLVTHSLQRLIKEVPAIPLQLAPEGLTDEQADACQFVANHSLTLLTGAPGTGKTFTAAKLIQEVLKVDPHHRILIGAPTGKAVGNLEKGLGALVGDKTQCVKTLRVKTLHALLGKRPGKLRAEEALRADLIIVDEGSMIDVAMMATLLTAIPSGARLVLMGDADQLPPVEAGSLFADMAASLGAAELKECLRVETASLVELAQKVKEGTCSLADFTTLPLTYETLLKNIAPLFPNPFVENIDLAALNDWTSFRLLAPIRKGPFGIEGLNALFYSHFKQQRPCHQSMLTPIIITKNAPTLSLYNGETGLYVEGEEEPYALFSSHAGGVRKIMRPSLPPYELAYCLSVHKSQGSEFEKVAFVLSPGSEVFGRELFYTALTRAKRSFALYGSPYLLSEMMGKRCIRRSNLAHRLKMAL